MKNRKHQYVVILAGGVGTRFWPLSRTKTPKQFLDIVGKTTLFQQTIDRVKSLVPGKNVLVITNERYKRIIQTQCAGSGILSKNILCEPSGRNTAPAICWAAKVIAARDPQGIMIVLPSDHLIEKKKKYLNVLRSARELAQQDFLVTLGIVPTRAETGYGYLKIKKEKKARKVISRVEKFTEKPTLAMAKKFVQSKRYLWNSGMFIWKATTVLSVYKKHLPRVVNRIDITKSHAHFKRLWKSVPSISVDYGILEKAHNVVSVPAGGIGWSDLGSWEAVTEVHPKDKGNNILSGDIISINSQNIFVKGQKRLIAAIGLKDIIVVDTDDALLLCSTAQSQDVKKAVDILKRSKKKKYNAMV